jgi:hypothetical protein
MIPVSEPPAIVLEASTACSDQATADTLLRRTIAASFAPRAGWSVHVRVHRDAGSLRAEGDINDENDNTVAHRAISRTNEDCVALVRAVGVWATLVLDAELSRAHEEEVETAPPAHARMGRERDADHASRSNWLALQSDDDSSATKSAEKTIEIGSSAFMMSGTGGGSMAGSSLYSLIEMENAWFLRPVIEVGRTLQSFSSGSSAATSAEMGAARFEVCKRVSGPYVERRGIEFDACAESEVGAFQVDGANEHPLPIFAVGPTAGFHGEIDDNIAVELRGGAALNIARPSPLVAGEGAAPSAIAARIELAVSWRVR